MLIRVVFENFLLFKDKTEFSMGRGLQRSHSQHLIDVPKIGAQVLKFAGIYGGNASGKSNFILALAFIKHVVVDTRSIDTGFDLRRFKLNKKCSQASQYFEIVFVTRKQKTYSLAFELDDSGVKNEQLILIRSASEKTLYSRVRKKGKIVLMAMQLGDSAEQKRRLKYVAEDTRANQLFLNATVERNHPDLKDVYDWFNEQLVIIRPESIHTQSQFYLGNQRFIKMFNKLLGALDTGIVEIKSVKVSMDQVNVPSELRDQIKRHLSERAPGAMAFATAAVFQIKDYRYAFKKEDDGEITAHKLMTQHHDKDGNLVDFELGEESQGTQRLFDIIPFFIEQSMEDRVLFIDELSRSLHPELSTALVRNYLKAKTNSSQLIVATHETRLLDKELIRRDEVWFVNKSSDGSSEIYSLDEFKIRNDVEMRKNYNEGRYGGQPIIEEELLAF